MRYDEPDIAAILAHLGERAGIEYRLCVRCKSARPVDEFMGRSVSCYSCKGDRSPRCRQEARKVACRKKTNHLFKAGKIIAPDSCSCGEPWTQKHHPDYDDPLNVVFLCTSCHQAEHAA